MSTEKSTRRTPDLKDKPVEFFLTKEMNMSSLLEEGYQRKEITQLFTELSADGFGNFDKGSLGRGNSAKFVCFDGFPIKYTIKMQVRRLRNDYIGKPQVVVEEPKVSMLVAPAC